MTTPTPTKSSARGEAPRRMKGRKPAKGMVMYRCPICNGTTYAISGSVSHRCPARQNQPISQKGYRKLPEWTEMERVDGVTL